MAPSEDTYADALDILQEMYGKKMLAEHIRQLNNLKKDERNSDADGLRQLFLDSGTNINALKNLGVLPERIGTLLSIRLINSIALEIKKKTWTKDPANDMTDI